MKRPKEPKNLNFWLGVLSDPVKTQDFLNRAGEQTQKELRLAMAYKKWHEIQKRKEGKREICFVMA